MPVPPHPETSTPDRTPADPGPDGFAPASPDASTSLDADGAGADLVSAVRTGHLPNADRVRRLRTTVRTP
jgi:hypothetical protein